MNTATEVQQSAICHVCQRMFKSTEQLVKHCSMSQLHRQKVAEAKAREFADIKAEMKVYTYTQHPQISLCVYIHIYVYAYICLYTYIYMYIHI